MVKAAAGGGGKGMRVVRDARHLDEALEASAREATKAFGDGRLLIEKHLDGARHIEVQIIGDQHGTILHLFDRECSLQRRHQKVIEEAPAPFLSPDLRLQMCDMAVAIGRSIGYYSAGTVEFLVTPEEESFFIEVNARLQVEHPVTEMVTGLDLVQLQIEIAEGRPLSLSQLEIIATGHSVEGRLYAEDPAKDFLPAIGAVKVWNVPEKIDGLRIESATRMGIEALICSRAHDES
jgi:acetyl/propionyl-CoA carboxylase alpha subunit